jgi:hypothetical protein
MEDFNLTQLSDLIYLIELTSFNYPECHKIFFWEPRSQHSEFSIKQLSGGFLLDSDSLILNSILEI